MCAKDSGIGCMIVSPRGMKRELSTWLEFKCTNNQAEYEALTFGLKQLIGMGVRDVEAFGDSQLVVQQMSGESQCLDIVLNGYYQMCKDLVRILDTFHLEHV
jgi:ribonuclease HI